MNAQQIWPGTDYAMGYRPKGGPLPLDAKRVKARRIIKEPGGYGSKRERTFVEVMVVNDETGMPDDFDNLVVKTVTGREILEFWDEYIETVEDEREEYQQREREREEKRRQAEIRRREENAVYYIGQFLVNSWRKELQKREAVKKKEEADRKLKRYTRMERVMIGRGFKPGTFQIQEGYLGLNKAELVYVTLDELERWFGFDT